MKHNDFILIPKSGIDLINGLSSTQMAMLLFIVNTYRLSEGIRVTLTPKKKKEIKLAVDVSTTNSISNALRSMVCSGVLKRHPDDEYIFYVNPKAIYKGELSKYEEVLSLYESL